MTPLLSIRNLSKIYSGKRGLVQALNNVNLDIGKGEIFGLLGVNGAGKTTLSSILATLHPASSGDVLYNGISIYSDIARFRSALGYCPQTQNLDHALTVKENLEYDGRYYLLGETEIAHKCQELLERLELTKYAHFQIHQLSGGTRQRLLIARALMHNPQIIILDEPTVGLDPEIRRKLWKIIADLKELGITVILTTHYLDEAEILSDRVCILHKGQVRLVEAVKDLKEKHNMAKLEDIFIHLTQD